MKKHIITVNGFPGSGKSSTAKGVARELGFEHFSAGDFYRKMAADRGLTVEELNFTAEKQHEIDQEIDELLVKIGKEDDRLVIDSRMAFHWMPDSFKVFLELDPQTAAERTLAHIRAEGRVSQAGSSVEEIKENTEKRVSSEQKRYSALYGIDVTDRKNYDLVIDTKAHDLAGAINAVAAAYRQWISE